MNIASYIAEIDALKQELSSLLPMSGEQQDKLDKKFRLEFHYNSNHLEGNTLTYGETELLLIFDDTRGNHTFREYEEMKASNVALKLVEQEAANKEQPLTEYFIKNLNKILLVEPYWKEAITPDGQVTSREILVGDYKRLPNSVRLPNGEIFNYASPQETPILMGELIQWYKNGLGNKAIHPVQLAAQLHYRFVRIHPFDDGNGRISRLLMNYVLLYHNYPPAIIQSSDKPGYLNALHDADVGNHESFNAYIAQQLIWSLQLSIKAAKNESIEEQEDWKNELAFLKKELTDKEELSIRKTKEVKADVFKVKIIPFIFKVEDRLKEYSSLFFDRYLKVSYSRNNNSHIQPLRGRDRIIISNETFDEDSLVIYFEFKDFKKNGLMPFDVVESLRIHFHKLNYTLTYNKFYLEKFYHQDFFEPELIELSNLLGKSILQSIKEKII